MNTKIFLDDVRNPDYTYPLDPDGWVVVRNYQEFVEALTEHVQPEVISFDHDLGDDPETGMDCLHWLIERALDGITNLHEVDLRVHSANPAGADNLRGLRDSFLRSVKPPVQD